jgi:hypothetical protein
MIVDNRISLRVCRGESRRSLATGRQQSQTRIGECVRHHRGLRRFLKKNILQHDVEAG